MYSQRISWIEGVKTLSMLWIAWYHIDKLLISNSSELSNQLSLARLGFAGVHVFLIISGLGLTISTYQTQSQASLNNKQFSWKKFYIRRFIRIYPPYILAHIIFFITGAMLGKYADMPLGLGFFLSITGLRNFFANYFWYGPDAFWFIGLILQLYILFPFLFWTVEKLGVLRFFVCILTICFLSRIITSYSADSYEYTMGLGLNRLAEFCLGIVIGYNISTNNKISIDFFSIKNLWLWITFSLSLLILKMLYVSEQSLMKVMSFDLIVGIVAFVGLSILMLSITRISGLITNTLVTLGGVSYSFYLLHSPPIRPMFSALNKIGLLNVYINMAIYIILILYLSKLFTMLEKYWIGVLDKSQIINRYIR